MVTSQISGYAPAALGTACDFHIKSYLDASGAAIIRPEIITLTVSSSLVRRRLYMGAWSDTSNPAENWITLAVRFLLGGSLVGEIPTGWGTSSANLPEVLPALMNGGGASVSADDLLVTMNGSNAWIPATVLLKPFDLVIACDQIKVDIRQLQAIKNTKIVMACLSQLP